MDAWRVFSARFVMFRHPLIRFAHNDHLLLHADMRWNSGFYGGFGDILLGGCGHGLEKGREHIVRGKDGMSSVLVIGVLWGRGTEIMSSKSHETNFSIFNVQRPLSPSFGRITMETCVSITSTYFTVRMTVTTRA